MISCVGFENNGSLVATLNVAQLPTKCSTWMEGGKITNNLSLTKEKGGFFPFVTMVVCKIHMHGGFISNAPNQINKILNFTMSQNIICQCPYQRWRPLY
jgi:hypothetical protein